jgi:Ca2+-binding RTX toxin-like protein
MSVGSIAASILIANKASWSNKVTFSFAQGSLPDYYNIVNNPNAMIFPDSPERLTNFRKSYAESFVTLGLSDVNRDIVRDSLKKDIASFANVQFKEISNNENSNILIGALNYHATSSVGSNSIVRGWTYPPSLQSGTSARSPFEGDIWIPLDGQGDSAGHTLRHELGHALGIMHTFKPGASGLSIPLTGLSNAENNQKFSIMAQNLHSGEGRDVESYQIYDIAALQYLYGRSDALNAEDTVYATFDEDNPGDGKIQDRVFSIWDGGGKDTILAANYAGSAYIDLRPGHFSSIGPEAFKDNSEVKNNWTIKLNSNGTLGRENISIAFGAYIENAIGGNANDVIIGNIFGNFIGGGKGNDILFGDGFGIAAADAVLIKLGLAPTGLVADLHTASRDADYRLIIKNHVSVNSLLPIATTTQDTISGGEDDDLIVGGKGDNVLFGGDGNDIIVIISKETNLAYGDAGNDKIFGAGGDDYIDGGAGDDYIDGGGGNDRLVGGAGNDQLYGGTGDDVFFGSAGGEGNDTFIGGADVDVIDYSIHYEEVPPTAGIEINIGRAGGAKSTKSSVTITDIYGGTDTIVSGIERVAGTENVDTLRASSLKWGRK